MSEMKNDAIGKKYDIMAILPNGTTKQFFNAELAKEDMLGKTFVINTDQITKNLDDKGKSFVAFYPQNISMLIATEVIK